MSRKPIQLCAMVALAASVLLPVSSAQAEDSSADAVNMDAPGRSSVPSPSFGPVPRLQRRNDYSSQNMAFELRFGPYAPRIDDSSNTPVYDNFFGDKTRFMFGLEVDYQVWRVPHVGTLGVGLGWGYTRLAGANKPPNAAEPPDTRIDQKSTLNIMPMYGVGVFRVDVLAREFSIPLVGYGKYGLAYALWWINDGNGVARDAQGRPAKDHSVGTQAALGAMFLLDVLEPSAGKELDSAAGINNSYVFLEWSTSNYGGDQMNVGASTWVTGLAVEL
jgi:hypothetical protein